MLKGIKVIDFSKWLPGQYCGMMLGDFGAEVIKVENPKGDEPRRFRPQKAENMSYWHMMLNRNKRDVTIDIKTAEGVTKLKKLLQHADVFLEGFRPGYLKLYGLDYDSVKAINPNLVYVSITGFGQKSHKPAHDMNVVGMAALTCTDGGQSVAVPEIQMSALGAGTNAFAAICMALLNRERNGGGKYIDVSLYATAMNLEVTQIAAHYGCREKHEQPFSRFTHYYNVYRCKDGRYLTVGTLEPKFWQELCNLLELSELLPRQFDFEHEKELIEIIGKKFATKTQQEWLAEIGDRDFCVTPVCNLQEALASQLTQEQNILQTVKDKEYGTLHYVGYPFKISDYEKKTPRRAEKLGESNDKI